MASAVLRVFPCAFTGDVLGGGQSCGTFIGCQAQSEGNAHLSLLFSEEMG